MAQIEIPKQEIVAGSLPQRSSARRWTIWIVLVVLLMILGAVEVCSRWSIRGLLPPLIDKSGRSQLDANYSPWEVALPPIQLDIPRLATAASRGEEDWTTGNPPPTATSLPNVALAPTSTPTPTASPTPDSSTGGGTTGGGSSSGGSSSGGSGSSGGTAGGSTTGGTTGGVSTPEPPSAPTSTPISGVTGSSGGGGGGSCGSSCSSDGDCAGLGPNPVCAGGSCYDSQTCGTSGGGGSTTGSSTGGSTGGPTPPSGVTNGG